MGKGGIVVFSSLTPHLTGPNTTDAVRKAYILQYALPDGATIVTGDPADGDPTGRSLADAPDPPVPDPRRRERQHPPRDAPPPAFALSFG